MTRIHVRQLVTIIGGDEEVVPQLREAGFVCDDEDLSPDEVDECLVAYTLVHELDVNWAGVEVILRMRRDLLEARHQLSRLAAELRKKPRGPSDL